ncbi:MAG: hypothetical protein U5L08_07355 [Xanthomonadales bacterium]|nr:hypothetical protein [Xanthomonadales bacterium]
MSAPENDAPNGELLKDLILVGLLVSAIAQHYRISGFWLFSNHAPKEG